MTGLERLSEAMASVEKALGLKSRGEDVRFKSLAGRDGACELACDFSRSKEGD